jgi:hypothetical protein
MAEPNLLAAQYFAVSGVNVAPATAPGLGTAGAGFYGAGAPSARQASRLAVRTPTMRPSRAAAPAQMAGRARDRSNAAPATATAGSQTSAEADTEPAFSATQMAEDPGRPAASQPSDSEVVADYFTGSGPSSEIERGPVLREPTVRHSPEDHARDGYFAGGRPSQEGTEMRPAPDGPHGDAVTFRHHVLERTQTSGKAWCSRAIASRAAWAHAACRAARHGQSKSADRWSSAARDSCG